MNTDTKRSHKNLIYNLLTIIAIAAVIVLFRSIIMVQVDGDSMNPTYQNNQSVIGLTSVKVKRFDAIVFDASTIDPKYSSSDDSKYYIKRVIGMPGDTVSYSNTGQLYINDKSVTQSFISQKAQTTGTLDMSGTNHPNGFTLTSLSQEMHWKYGPVNNKVPKNYYFVLGDNRSISNDSRYYGLIPKSKIKAVILNTKDTKVHDK